ncbi:MAG: aspartate--tRNA ligase [Acholeplasmatales bacterium]
MVNNNELRKKDIGRKVTLRGWVSRRRDLGGLIFIDLRDYHGITQLTFKPEMKSYKLAQTLKAEYVIKVTGEVILRESINKDLPTGEIEVLVAELIILNVSEPLPIGVGYQDNALEETRLRYRYLDLRKPEQQRYLIKRHEITQAIRAALLKDGFFELETPILGKSTPEGARDFLVPSRLYHGSFYALPQSPQLYKQLYMVSGFEKYFQFAKCFRDEDLRADRQLEFTQVDIECSFMSMDEILAMCERMISHTFKAVLNIDLKTPFLRLSYKDAMSLYGSDKPDLRYDLKLEDAQITGIPFLEGKVIRKITLKDVNLTRKEIDALTIEGKKNHLEGLAFLKYEGGNLTGSISKFFEASPINEGELVLYGFGNDYERVSNGLGAIRRSLAKHFNLIDESVYNFLWVVDFPLLEYSIEEDRYVARHHPFTSSKNGLDGNKADLIANAYDMVLNGYELGGGSIRIHNAQEQRKMFELLGMDEETIQTQFGFLVEALKYGTPPHGGIAFGLDRIVMLMTNTNNIRDVIAFPKIQSARDIMLNAPDKVSNEQLKELGIMIKEDKDEA